ncbi:phosphate ABC transporter permease subunit PstC [Effusibacillus lacus]|uniref:Phosphate transport system permease protein n=1 Tax=Effusibacillus lacus TaxID=1348429 RepID=A0A292YIZ5_9BACL|nr:phosphate ABC transporter permease subunit PstC [Effusibacillus lacus]TCS69797.1 phosphate ABC transporter membrane protein 1 (PhoT family) [Effusibacillus lacus]GAX88879.1 phosphate ABC transporter permease subunit PstC [Effusibacillus lacus]
MTNNQPIVAKKTKNKRDFGIRSFLLLCASVSILTTVGIVFELLFETINFFREVSLFDFLTDTEWSPTFQDKHFGILTLLSGSFLITLGASLVALPFGLATAIYLSEYAPDRVRRTIKPILEILAGVPTIVYGFFALTFVTPIIRAIFPTAGVFNALSASIVVGIMILPMVASLSEDAMVAVPRSLRDGAYALGATKMEVATKVVVPAGLSGIIASFVLALSRAIGETMIVTIAAGATPKLTLNPLESVQTMTAYIVQVSLGDIQHGTIEYRTLFAVGMTLFLLTLLINIIAQWITRRYREEY